MSFPVQTSKPSFSSIYESVHQYWSENHIFEQSISDRSDDNQFRFYDGPPFVTGLPHYGHLASSVAKDVIPRFQTMKGKKVDRVRGWDCHGIPIEQKVQKKLGLESNLDIEKVGIETFINECYNYTRSTSSEWKRYIDQFARWVDFDNSYKTMDNDYMESVRRVFKTLRDKGLIYKGKRVSLYSTKLETPISNFEVAMDDTYEEVNDPAITVMLDLSINGAEYANTFALVWTTTPWTIPVNIAAGVHKDILYSTVRLKATSDKPQTIGQESLKLEAGSQYYIVASKRVESVFAGKEYEIVDTFMGEKLVGLSYKPPFDYLYGKTGNDKDHKIYHADFVSDEDGTGLVHEAPEFGEVDFQLAKQVGLTITEAMDSSGHYTSLLRSPLGGALTAEAQEMSEGQEGNPPLPLPQREGLHGIFYRDANPIVIQKLHDMGRLFHKASITHRVAFCPRSGTPLVFKAQDSWFIDINGKQEIFDGKSLKEMCIEANEQINRYPAHNKHGRFLKSLETAPDRCISRTRYWGTPMPIYKKVAEVQRSKGAKEENIGIDSGSIRANDMMVIGSREELFQFSKNGSKNLVKHVYVRHGQTDYNVAKKRCSRGDARLTELGEQQAIQAYLQIKNQVSADDVIILSPLYRTFQTAAPTLQGLYPQQFSVLEQEYLKISQSFQIMFDDETIQEYIHDSKTQKMFQLIPELPVYVDFRLCELLFSVDQQGSPSFGTGALKDIQLQWNYEPTHGLKCEGQRHMYDRIASLIDQVNKDFANHQVYYFAHGGTGRHFLKYFQDYDFEKEWKTKKIKNTEIKTFYRNTTRNAELDLHRPFIDDVWFEKDGVRYERISEVLDCWVESASMPYAQVHYPFENKEKFEKSFPADYIVEYTGQIRAWFYVMHVLGVALFDAPAFKNVICHGVIAGNDGRKMSKSLGNFPDPKPTFEQYGGDAVRMSILTTSLFNGGDMAFSEELIKEALKQNVLPLWNAFYFFTTYANIDGRSPFGGEMSEGQKGNNPPLPLPQREGQKENLLDQRILSELSNLAQTIDTDLTNYDLTHSSRQIAVFLENLTNWYIRRSRRRFWKSENDGDKDAAYQTLCTVLVGFCTIAAPFMPIVTEYIYRALTENQGSVHLQSFPQVGVDYQSTRTIQSTGDLSDSFSQAQTIVRAGLAARSKRSIRVRQPLASLKLGTQLDPYFVELIADELNIKQVIYDPSLNDKVMKICKPDGKAIGTKFGGNTKEIFALAKSGQFVEHPDGSVAVGEWLLDPGTFEISYIQKEISDPGVGTSSGDIVVEEGIVMEIDREITPALAREGYARDLVRSVQDARKEADYDIADRIQLQITGDLGSTNFVEDIINYHGATIQEETLSTIIYTMSTPDITKALELGGNTISLSLKR